MATRRLVIVAVISAAIVGMAVLQYSRARKAKRAGIEDQMFVRTYVDLAVAGELYKSSPDSFKLVRDRIFSNHGTDSSWMENHVRSLGRDSARRQNLWETIVDSLEKINKGSLPETIMMFQSSSAVNADSI
jgi:hypothetical protein